MKDREVISVDRGKDGVAVAHVAGREGQIDRLTLLTRHRLDRRRELRVEKEDGIDRLRPARGAGECAAFEEAFGELAAEESSSAGDDDFHLVSCSWGENS